MNKSESRFFQGLYEAAAVLNSVHSPEEVLKALVEKVTATLGAKGCSLMLLTPDKKQLLHTAAYGLSDWYIRKGPVIADRSISETLTGKPVAVLDATRDERVQYQTQAAREGIISILSAPMSLRGETIGVVRVYTGKLYRFAKDEIEFVSAVANLGAIALESARLYDAVQKDYTDFRREMLEWRAALGSEWVAEGSAVVPPGEEPSVSEEEELAAR